MCNKVSLKEYSLEACHGFYKDYISDSAMTYDEFIYNEEQINRYYEAKVLDKNRIFFGIFLEDKIIGEIQIKKIDMGKLCGTLSIILINDQYKGRGYGTEAEKLIINYAKNHLGFKTIYADAVHRNNRSKYILEKLGFQHIYADENLAYYKLNVEDII